MKARKNILLALVFLLLLITGFYQFGQSFWHSHYSKHTGQKSVNDVMRKFAPRADNLLGPAFNKVGLGYPPQSLSLLSFKAEKRMEVWGKDKGENWIFVTSFNIQAASGKAGPKLKEGDYQVPEGIYKIEGLNPNSSFHVSMKLNYPNDFDQSHAISDGRFGLGGDIFIHGKAVSIGCLAMGDPVAEQLFVLVNRVGLKNVSVIIAPFDFREKGIHFERDPNPSWLPVLYRKIDRVLKDYIVQKI